MDALSFLLDEHHRFRSTMKALEHRDASTPSHVFVEFATDLLIHAALEEELVYPRLALMPELQTKTRHAYHEHHLLDIQLDELATATPTQQIWNDKLHVLKETLEHHLCEEEEEIFPVMMREITTEERQRLGESLADLREEYVVRYQDQPPRTAQGAATERITAREP